MRSRPDIYKLEPIILNFLEFTEEMINDLKLCVESDDFKNKVTDSDRFENIVEVLRSHKPEEIPLNDYNQIIIDFAHSIEKEDRIRVEEDGNVHVNTECQWDTLESGYIFFDSDYGIVERGFFKENEDFRIYE